MSNPTQTSSIRSSTEADEWAWDIQELDPTSPHLAQAGQVRYNPAFRARFKGFLATHAGDEVHLDKTAALAQFVKDAGHGYLTGCYTWTVSKSILRFILSYYDKGGFADMTLSDYLKAMANDDQSI